ncbi:Arc family DNA-binding protein [Pseudomonas sp. o96-267]|nr:Arc family DNA-binding protein [Pseudomonas sp. o96-267]RRV41278.1 Arc family DNA-binding protein [Pseudomonas sp. o96-267]
MRADPQMVVRVPEELKVWIKVQAALNRRSQNAEIVYRLEQAKKLEEAA